MTSGDRGVEVGKLTPLSTAKLPTSGLRRAPTPLLEEERHAGAQALIANHFNPGRLHCAAVWPAFALQQ